MQQVWWEQDVDVTNQNVTMSSDATKCFIDEVANLNTTDHQVDEPLLVRETKIEQTLGTILDATWWGPYSVTEIAQSLETYGLLE